MPFIIKDNTGYILSLTGEAAENAKKSDFIYYTIDITKDTEISCTFTLDTANHYVLASDTSTLATAENTTDAPDLIKVYKITVPSGTTVTGATKIDGDYYAEKNTSITLSVDGETIKNATGFTGTSTLNDDGSYTFTLTEDVTITELVYATVLTLEGEGTEEKPYLIASAVGLKNLADYVNSGEDISGKFFELTSDIELTGKWTSIGNNANPFNGNFDGGGYTISGLNINSNVDYKGLFGYVSDGTVANVTLVSPRASAETIMLALSLVGMKEARSAAVQLPALRSAAKPVLAASLAEMKVQSVTVRFSARRSAAMRLILAASLVFMKAVT